jgi:integrase
MAKGKGFYREASGRLVIQVYDPQTRSPRKIPSDEIAHLQNAADEEIAKWRALYIAENRHKARRTLERVLKSTDEAQYLFEQFLAEYSKLRRISSSTVYDENLRWNGYIVPYFVTKHGAKDIRLWELHTGQFPPWLHGQPRLNQAIKDGTEPLGVNQQKKVIGLLERFGQYLARRNLIRAPWGFIKPTENVAAETPLEIEATPEDILKWSASREPKAALMGLLGYFASLRPEELFALRKSDILAGEPARTKAKTYPRLQQHGLGSGVSVDVQRAFQKNGKVDEVKTPTSRAVANVFSVEAARRIATLLRDMPDGWLFPRRKRVRKGVYEYLYNAPKPVSRDTSFKYWREYGYHQGRVLVTLHDLRRASGVYLGRTLDLPATLVQEHLRHADLKTTMLYMRRPSDRTPKVVAQNWDDVG